jgi:hypothetical protein
MAGGALGGVIGAALRVLPSFKEEWIQTPFYENMPSRSPFRRWLLLAFACTSGSDR